MADLIEKERTLRTGQGGISRRLLRHAHAWGAVITIAIVLYAAYVYAGAHARARVDGRVAGMPVNLPAVIYRDERDIPHIRAADRRDAFVAEGFAQGSDRLFQMDLFRRYIYGELAEVLGPVQLPLDERMRALDIREVAQRQWRALSGNDRRALQAFSEGVNAAARVQPLPVEFRLLLYRPAPWRPQDSLAVALAIAASIGDTPENVLARDGLWHSLTRAQYAQLLPLSDPRYDVSIAGRFERRRTALRAIVRLTAPGSRVAIPAAGSNAWAAGGALTGDGHALLANDPHLVPGIPGIWYAVEMRAPGLHVAGVTIAGIPGVVLGHNDRLAWGTTAAATAALSLFRATRLDPHDVRREEFHVRFSASVTRGYYRTARELQIPDDDGRGVLLMRRPAYASGSSAVSTVLALDRANSIESAMRVLRSYTGAPQNFVIAGDDGRVAYHLAGSIPDDPAWGRYVHPERDLVRAYPPLPFDRLPSLRPSRDARIVSANNKMYGAGYRYRLSAMFAPPYRAYRIARLLHARRRYDAAYFARMQMDVRSPADAALAHRIAALARRRGDLLPHAAIAMLASWDGSFTPGSCAATLERELRTDLERVSVSPYDAIEALRAPKPPARVLDAIRDPLLQVSQLPPWSAAGAVPLLHPFGSIGFPFLNGAVLRGDGDEYTIHVQTPGLAQSFRAVWEPGAWEHGGLALPAGESGEIGSPHYRGRTAAWEQGVLQPLPFSDASVRRSARHVLTLVP